METLMEALDLSNEEINSIGTFSLTREKSGKWNIILYGGKINNTKISLESLDWDDISSLGKLLDDYLLAKIKETKKAKKVVFEKPTNKESLL